MSQRSRRSFFRVSAIASSLICLLACGGGGGASSDEATLVLRIATQANGMAYRLTNASFEVTGAETVTVTTPNPPVAASLQETLLPGMYSVRLADGWTVEQQMGASFQPVGDATISSMNPAMVNLVRGQVTTVGFVFAAGAVSVDFAQAAAGENDDSYD